MVESMHSLLMPLDLDEDEDDGIGTADEEEACWWRYLDDYQRGGPVFMSPEACFYGQSCHFRSTCSRHHSTFLVAPGLITPATCFCEDIWCCAGHPLRDVAYQALSADERRSFAEQYMRERAHFGACYQTSLQQAVLVALLAHPGAESGRVASKLRLQLSVPCRSTSAVYEALEGLEARGLVARTRDDATTRWVPAGTSPPPPQTPRLKHNDARIKKQLKELRLRPACWMKLSDLERGAISFAAVARELPTEAHKRALEELRTPHRVKALLLGLSLNQQVFRCPDCDKGFLKRGQLNIHRHGGISMLNGSQEKKKGECRGAPRFVRLRIRPSEENKGEASVSLWLCKR